MNTSMSRPISEAQKVLKGLYDSRCAQSGKPSFEQFYPINLEHIATLLGWHIERVTIAGYSQAHEPLDAKADFDKKIITLSVREKVPGGRINFSLAHEIGHILLHGEKGVKTLWRTRPIREKEKSGSYRHPYEVEADRFAKELLMPIKAVKYYFKQLFSCTEIMVDSVFAKEILKLHHPKHSLEVFSIRSLAKSIAIHTPEHRKRSLVNFFDVSDEAMAIRLMELRLVLD